MAKLSPVMRDCLDVIKDRGALIRHDGGFWAGEDTPMKDGGLGIGQMPVWHYGTNTIYALEKRGEIVITKRRDRDGMPLRAEPSVSSQSNTESGADHD